MMALRPSFAISAKYQPVLRFAANDAVRDFTPNFKTANTEKKRERERGREGERERERERELSLIHI